MSQFQKYNDYKSSGVKWLGDVPRHWEVKKLKSICSAFGRIGFRGYTTADLVNENQGAITISPSNIDDDKMMFEKCTYLSWEKYEQSPEIKIFNQDILIVKTGSTFGKIGLVKNLKKAATINPQLLVLKNIKIDNIFLFYQLKTPIIQTQINREVVGSTIPTISESKILNFISLIPPLEEQTAIAQYLDQKTAQLDTAIAQKQRMIELLKERRQILIHRAVTQGLDPSVKMKDSGVEWIGSVPEHWGVVKTKFITNFVYDGTHGSYPRVSNGYRLLSVRNIIDDRFVFRDDDSCVSEKHFKEISSKFLIKEGDIQLAIVGATLGKAAIVDKYDELFVTQRSVCTIRVNENQCLTKFLFYFIKSEPFQSYLWLNAGFSAQPGVYLGTIQNSYVPLPSIEEQESIIANIEFVNQKLATAIRLKESEIAKLKEYKGSLINSVVTGKVRVV